MTTKNSQPFPILTTERLTLRQLSTEDKEVIFKLRSDIETNKYLNRNPSKTIEDAIQFHGGEAESRRKAFFQLSPQKQEQIIKFIQSL